MSGHSYFTSNQNFNPEVRGIHQYCDTQSHAEQLTFQSEYYAINGGGTGTQLYPQKPKSQCRYRVLTFWQGERNKQRDHEDTLN